MAPLLLEIFLLLAAAYSMAYGLSERVGAPVALVVGIVLLAVLAVRGWRTMRQDAKTLGWASAALRVALVASAVLCVRRLKNGHWF